MTILASGPHGLSQPHHQPLRRKITGCCHTSQLKMGCRKATLYLWPIGIKGEVPGSNHPPNWQCSRWPPEVPHISYFTYESKSFTMTLIIINSRCYVLLGQCDTSQTEVVDTTNISCCTPFMCLIWARGHLRALPGGTEDAKMWNASRFCMSSLHRGHANLLCIVPILPDVLRRESSICYELRKRHMATPTPKRGTLLRLCVSSLRRAMPIFSVSLQFYRMLLKRLWMRFQWVDILPHSERPPSSAWKATRQDNSLVERKRA